VRWGSQLFVHAGLEGIPLGITDVSHGCLSATTFFHPYNISLFSTGYKNAVFPFVPYIID
jgi:hypothetical protein